MNAVTDLTGRVIIVTGAGAGIGRVTAQHLSELGARVVAASLEAPGDLPSPPASDLYVQTDVRDEASIQAMIDRTVARFGRVDGLVNNAGVTVQHDFFEATAGDFDHLIHTNLRSVFLCSQRAARVMRGHGGGVIVNVASNHAGRSVAGYEVYAATKGAVVSMTRALAWSLGPHGIRVVSVSPGLTWVEGLRGWIDHDPQALAHFQAAHATGRANLPEDVAHVIAFVLSDAARGITGEDLVADNGMSARLFPPVGPVPDSDSPFAARPSFGDPHEDH